ncbi:hypothetical protein VitviT2T_006999 [Vitis vinifera]|uniref:Pectinesterase n=2 Tax=Vitis vinifera TaxID=29760 RepID=A0ABY9BXW1_VITVI|nr:probable pectinesterase 29 [Vitis vinifera]WJZ87631.1 hypothetical protein VitviT2T_006999 [Vitis vinifera]|eukprot:XP_002263748.1 PREDICTED: probable pectinesterase 29 [Vitis vinifera]
MAPHRWHLSALLALFIVSQQAVSINGVAYHTITVDQSGHGNFRTIQSAINSIPSNNNRWICIYVKAGIYREKVVIPMDKPFIFLRGAGRKRTFIVWGDHLSISQSPTFSMMADNFVARGISFMNNYNLPVLKNRNPRKPAVAAMIAGDKASFYKCSFYGVQDTLWDVEGRHYFKGCFIEGAVDFIFGAGQSIYEKCMISVVGRALGPGIRGFITAQGRDSPKETNGFVFKECKVTGDGQAYLGRPWRVYSRVLFYKTEMPGIIVPAGWDPWNYSGKEQLLTYAEHDCYGAGADTSKRVSWEKRLSTSTVMGMTSLGYINAEGWLNGQP